MQHRSRDLESSWPDGDVRDRYALCALTGTAFSIICEFRANFELRASLRFSGLLLFLFRLLRFLSFFFPLPAVRFFVLCVSRSAIGFRHIRCYKSARDVSHLRHAARALCPLSVMPTRLHQLHDIVRTPGDAHRPAPDKKRLTGAVLSSVRQSTSGFFGSFIVVVSLRFLLVDDTEIDVQKVLIHCLNNDKFEPDLCK